MGAQHARQGRRTDAVRLLEAASSGYAAIGAAGLLARVAADLRDVTGVPGGLPARPEPAPSRPGTTPAWPGARRDQQPGRPDPAPDQRVPGQRDSVGPGNPGPLTVTELRVAAAIANGLSNQEAALRLSVSPKTIEFHLGNIYRKLAIRTRTQLARAMAVSTDPG